ncbi:hypothetical protein [Streptomyces sp. SP18CS02]|uniref:hypothetical protein n=1 Tax=Streptomyces sp. SP18CS02 TaxID=3002531 RepID=UPI002E7AA9D9|nr:hypothetical protein [Streptomyces sp. SP18CS02]MEE1754080.1 hypothetical protein [Streptomyces sp. SP18CS02]
MRRRMSPLAVTALVAGGVLLGTGAAPAGAAVQPAMAGAGKVIRCDIPEMRQQAAALGSKAARLDRLGERAAAKRARARADAVERKVHACVEADRNA